MSSGTEGAYEGPPVNVPPPPGWRVDSVAKPNAPRRMPEQDHEAVDAAEQRARLVTHWTALLAVAMMFTVLIIGLLRGLVRDAARPDHRRAGLAGLEDHPRRQAQ